MCPITQRASPPPDTSPPHRVADVLRASPPLSACQTVAELCELKPDVGAVLLGGNYLGAQHSLEASDALTCTVGAKHVVRCCFVGSSGGSRWAESVLLSHGAPVADLKCVLYRLKPAGIETAMTAIGAAMSSASRATVTTEEDVIGAVICRDPEGKILAEADCLPSASTTACGDVGYHSLMFFDIEPPSMMRRYVQTRISNTSTEAIDSFVLAPRAFGLTTYDGPLYPSAFETMRGELSARLLRSTREVPARLATERLHEIRNFYAGLVARARVPANVC